MCTYMPALCFILLLTLSRGFIASLRIPRLLYKCFRFSYDHLLLLDFKSQIITRLYDYKYNVDERSDISAEESSLFSSSLSSFEVINNQGDSFDIFDKNGTVIESSECSNSNSIVKNKSRKQYVKLTFSNPSGLLITEIKRNHTSQWSDENNSNVNGTYRNATHNNDSHTTKKQPQQSDFICMLQHDVLRLRPQHSRVFEMPGALTKETCANIILQAEQYAKENDGWTRTRHIAYPTTDLPLDAVFGKFSSIRGLTNGIILPELARLFQLEEEHLHIGEMFIAKYEYKIDGSKQNALRAHLDGPPWSFVVTLNDPSTEFEGGGTHFLNNQETYRPTDVGTAVLFSGKNLHSGVAVTQGIRYILTGFCDYYNPRNRSHELFMSNYDQVYDGSAARGGLRTGDVLRGMWTSTGSGQKNGRNVDDNSNNNSMNNNDKNTQGMSDNNDSNHNNNNNIKYQQVLSKNKQQHHLQQQVTSHDHHLKEDDDGVDDNTTNVSATAGMYIDFTGMNSEQLQQTIYDCTNNQDGLSSESSSHNSDSDSDSNNDDASHRRGNLGDRVTILVERESLMLSDDSNNDNNLEINQSSGSSSCSSSDSLNNSITLKDAAVTSSDVTKALTTTIDSNHQPHQHQQHQHQQQQQQQQEQIDEMIESVKRDAYYRLAIGNYWKFDDYMTFRITGGGSGNV